LFLTLLNWTSRKKGERKTMSIVNPWLVGSLGLLVLWLLIFFLKPKARKEMLWVSVFTMLLGLTEPLFVPQYWNPPSLFDLAQNTGFDLESFIFSFAIGGISAILYELLVKVKHEKIRRHEKHKKMHRYHLLALFSPLLVFLPLQLFTSLNPIYSASIAMFAGGIAAILCRPDLSRKIVVGGFSFLSLYFVFFIVFGLAYPRFVQDVWNLTAISGILIWGVPLEELLFAFTVGMLWSSIYEHTRWYRLVKIKTGQKNKNLKKT